MKKTVAVFFGGQSTEHDISIITAISAVIKPLQLTGAYRVVPVYITKQGTWYSDNSLMDVALYQGSGIEQLIKKQKPLLISFDQGLVLQKQGFNGERIRIDVAFPAMHGTYGEDGSLMGLLRMANIPFVGSDMVSSVVAMDKVLAKQVVAASQIPTSNFYFFSRKEFNKRPQDILKAIEKQLKMPVFVKPAHLGSSIGISRATDTKTLQNAIEVAAHYDDKIIVEEEVPNLLEVTIPIIGNDEPEAALPERPLSHGEKFFDFDTKYMHGGKKTGGAKQAGAQGYSELPANMPQDLYDQAILTAKAVYVATGASGISRVDLLIDQKSKLVYFNEINPLPGSLYAHNWRQAGVSGVELVTRLINYAEERFKARQELEHTFSTSFLQQFK